MSKMGQWVFEMQEDATMMTYSDFIDKHGLQSREIWEQMNGPDHDNEPDLEGYYDEG